MSTEGVGARMALKNEIKPIIDKLEIIIDDPSIKLNTFIDNKTKDDLYKLHRELLSCIYGD